MADFPLLRGELGCTHASGERASPWDMHTVESSGAGTSVLLVGWVGCVVER